MFNSMQHKVWKLFNKETTTTTQQDLYQSQKISCVNIMKDSKTATAAKIIEGNQRLHLGGTHQPLAASKTFLSFQMFGGLTADIYLFNKYEKNMLETSRIY